MTIETRLAEIRVRVEAATTGPWMVNGPGEEWAAISSGPHAVIHAYTVHDGDCPGCECGDGAAEVALTIEDAEFIAASRTDLPALLAAVEAVSKRADRWASRDRPEGDDFYGEFNAGVRFAAGHILRDITAELEVQG